MEATKDHIDKEEVVIDLNKMPEDNDAKPTLK